MAFWESAAEGREARDAGKHGWKLRLRGYVVATRYHFFLMLMLLCLFAVPFALDWSLRLLALLAIAFLSGIVLEDFRGYVVNPR